MKTLNMNEVAAVSGGSYDLTVTMFVPDVMENQVADLFQGVITGQIIGMDQFVNGLINLGPEGNAIRLKEVTFQNFN